MTEKYCLDCAFCTDQYNDYGARFVMCRKMPKETDLGTGAKPDLPFFTCRTARAFKWNCGASAKWFEDATWAACLEHEKA